jgi:hypothetical protein
VEDIPVLVDDRELPPEVINRSDDVRMFVGVGAPEISWFDQGAVMHGPGVTQGRRRDRFVVEDHGGVGQGQHWVFLPGWGSHTGRSR